MTATTNKFNIFCSPLPQQCKHHQPLPIFSVTIAVTIGSRTHSLTTLNNEQECIPVGYVPPTHYHITKWGNLPDRDPLDRDLPPDKDPHRQRPPSQTETSQTETPRQRPPGQRPPDRDPQTETPWTEIPWTEIPLDRDLSSEQRPLLWTETPPLDRDPPGQRPPCHVNCDACWDRDPASEQNDTLV